jgi:hypothetical protein
MGCWTDKIRSLMWRASPTARVTDWQHYVASLLMRWHKARVQGNGMHGETLREATIC